MWFTNLLIFLSIITDQDDLEWHSSKQILQAGAGLCAMGLQSHKDNVGAKSQVQKLFWKPSTAWYFIFIWIRNILVYRKLGMALITDGLYPALHWAFEVPRTCKSALQHAPQQLRASRPCQTPSVTSLDHCLCRPWQLKGLSQSFSFILQDSFKPLSLLRIHPNCLTKHPFRKADMWPVSSFLWYSIFYVKQD